MARGTTPIPIERGAIERLMASERVWREQLDAARAEADRLLADVRAEGRRAEAALDADLPALVERRREELVRGIEQEATAAREQLLRRAARYESIDEAGCHRIALALASRIPWLPPAVAGLKVRA